MRPNFMMIGLIFWTFATSWNYFACKNLMMGMVFFCYAVANIFLFVIGNKYGGK